MCEPFCRFFRFFVTVLCLFVLSRVSSAQVADVRTVETLADGFVVEVTASWPLPLAAAVDSARASALSEGAVMAVSSSLFSVSETFELPGSITPLVQLTASDFDEVDLPFAAGADSVAAWLNQPPVEVVALGVLRKRPTATVGFRLVTYDEARGVLRRYRRMLVRVNFGAAGAANGLDAAAKTFAPSDNPHLNVTRSVLADGTVFKIPITTEGVYRIDRALLSSILSQAGLSVDAIRPDQIRIYGNGGAPLPALNSAPRPADLIENPILVRASGNSFTELFFYAAPTSGWTYNTTTGEWEHYINRFSNTNYYFLKIDAEVGTPKRLVSEGFPSLPGAKRINRTTGRHFVEPEEVLWNDEHASGLTWVSRQIRSGQSIQILDGAALPGLTSGEAIVRARIAANTNPSTPVRFELNGAVLGDITAPPVNRGAREVPAANPAEARFVGQISGGPVDLVMTLQPRINEPQAALDWVRLLYPQALTAVDGYLRFATPPGQVGPFELALSGFSQEPVVLDVTDPGSIRMLGVNASGGTYLVQVEANDPARPRELVAFVPQATRAPESSSRVAPQNLHGIQTFPDFVIVAPDTFRTFAEELAEMRRKEGLEVEVVDIEQIYNEFSGGLVDMRAVRDYFRFLYDRAPNDASMLRYALLFGDGHYDYREITNPPFRNWIPPYESLETFHPLQSYASDDYFGLLDENEGIWTWGSDLSVSSERMDIGIGRLTVQSAADARIVIDKIKHYESPETFGAWRSRYTFVADDAYNTLAATNQDSDLHVQNADVVAEEVKQRYSPINLNKIYAPSYTRVFQNGWRIPGVERDIQAAIENGTLLINYSGHGGEDGLAQERIFTVEHAQRLQNRDRLSVFVTVTCSFGRWDMTDEQSGGEVLLLNPNGGAVALLTTVRTVYTSAAINSLNVGLNRALNQALFRRDETGRPQRFGDAYLEAKNTQAGLQSNNRKFSLIGDPTMRLGLPGNEAVITAINDSSLTSGPVQMKALDRMKIQGEVRRVDGTLDNSFNGQVNVTVFDAERNVMLPYQRHMPTPYYTIREDLVWRGDVDVRDGRFEAHFVVPKDISYSNRPGRISAYAWNDETHALGYTDSLIVGGSSATPPDDSQGPVISFFMNDTTTAFVSGALTTARPELIIKLEDESGVNTVGAGVGHELLLVLDDDEQNAVDVSSFYQSEQNSYQRGVVRYPLAQLAESRGSGGLTPGLHTVRVRAWDVLNNSSTASVDFYVSDSEELVLRNIYNYPNPTSGETRFIFEHNQPAGVPARIQLRIYTLSGRPVRTIETEEALPSGVMPAGLVQIPWDGRDEDFDELATGIYLYKLRVEIEAAEGERQVSEHIEKLAIIR